MAKGRKLSMPLNARHWQWNVRFCFRITHHTCPWCCKCLQFQRRKAMPWSTGTHAASTLCSSVSHAAATGIGMAPQAARPRPRQQRPTHKCWAGCQEAGLDALRLWTCSKSHAQWKGQSARFRSQGHLWLLAPASQVVETSPQSLENWELVPAAGHTQAKLQAQK